MNTSILKTLKIGQKLHVHIHDGYGHNVYEATVEKDPIYLRIGWEGSRNNGLSRECAVFFNEAGNQVGTLGFSPDGWGPYPLDMEIIPVE
jgi:hypothetical protein